MFLNEVIPILDRSESPLAREAKASWKYVTEGLTNSLRIIRSSDIQKILFDDSPGDYRESLGRQFTKWEKGEWPSLASIVFMAAQHFIINFESSEMRAIETASVLGEIPNRNQFHNNEHFRKITLAAIRQISTHNSIYKGTEWELGVRDISLLLSAGPLHDFCHDGKGNLGIPFRLELQAYNLAQPFLDHTGVDADWLADLKTIILCTDVNPPGQAIAPAEIAKAAYDYWFLGKGSKPKLPEELSRLKNNPRLSLLSVMFHEGDLLPSVLNLERFMIENKAFNKEVGMSFSYKGVQMFLNDICSFVTKAGKKNSASLNVLRGHFDEKAANENHGSFVQPDAELSLR